MTLIDTGAAAVYLRVTQRTIRRMVTRGQLTNHGTSRAIRVDLDQLDQVNLCTSSPPVR